MPASFKLSICSNMNAFVCYTRTIFVVLFSISRNNLKGIRLEYWMMQNILLSHCLWKIKFQEISLLLAVDPKNLQKWCVALYMDDYIWIDSKFRSTCLPWGLLQKMVWVVVREKFLGLSISTSKSVASYLEWRRWDILRDISAIGTWLYNADKLLTKGAERLSCPQFIASAPGSHGYIFGIWLRLSICPNAVNLSLA